MCQFVSIVFLAALVSGDPIKIQYDPMSILSPLSPTGRIVGGRETSIEEHPWQVSLQAYGFHFCGGSIISKNVILTAGHCATYSPDLVTIRLGTSIMEAGGAVLKVTEIKRHENYVKNNRGVPENDIGIIKLATDIEFGKTAQPIPLFEANEMAIEGTLSTISGWGSLMEDGSNPERLRTVDVPIVTKAKCAKAYESWGGIPDNQICAAYPSGGKDTCQGDSGGPLVINGRQAGIVSWGNGCARKGYPGVYTEIASYREWLAKNANV